MELNGATPLALALSYMPVSLKGPDARAIVAELATQGNVTRAVLPGCELVRPPLATPLEAAAANSCDDVSALRALLQHGASAKGDGGSRALLACLAAGCPQKAQLLVSLEVR